MSEVSALATFLPPRRPEYRADAYVDRLRRRVCVQIRTGTGHIAARRLGLLYARLTRVQHGQPGYELSRMVAAELHGMEAMAWAAADRDRELSHRLAMTRQGLHAVELDLQQAIEVLR